MSTPESELARDEDERLALQSLLVQEAMRLSPPELRAACVSAGIGDARTMDRIPTRLLVSTVANRAWTEGRLQALYEAVVKTGRP